MHLDRPLIWLASYPKSGNTWVRAVLANYLNRAGNDADINALGGAPIASARSAFDACTLVRAAELSAEEIRRCRPDLYRYWASVLTAPTVVKVHDAYDRTDPVLFPREVTRASIYVIRHPFDVAVSYAHHRGKPLQQVIDDMCSEAFALADAQDRLPEQLRQHVGSWGSHVASWVDRADPGATVLRYEDLLARPHETFATLVKAIRVEIDRTRIAAAIERCSFERLQEQERRHGFRERPPASPLFFRRGTAGEGTRALSRAQQHQLADAHGEIMERFNYGIEE